MMTDDIIQYIWLSAYENLHIVRIVRIVLDIKCKTLATSEAVGTNSIE